MTNRFVPSARAALAAALLAFAAPAARAGDARPDPFAGRPPEPFAVESALAESAFAATVTTNNLIQMTITNYGFLGNNFSSRNPSLVYPKGAPQIYEHLVRGGFWVGAEAQDQNGAFTSVVTATTDGSQGGASAGNTEWTPQGKSIEVRSILPNSKFFSPLAVSEEDLIAVYDDRTVRRAAFNNETHRPMGIEVTQSAYAWAFSSYQHAVIFSLKIRNTGAVKTNVWVGFYSEFASGNKTAYLDRNIWPPSSTGSAVGGWYSKKLIAYDDSLRLFRERYCNAQPVPDNCNVGLSPYWIGVRLLGARGLAGDTTTRRITMQAWNYDPSSAARDQDVERYEIMSRGVAMPIEGDSLMPQTGDPVGLLAVGPFPILYTDSTITVDFAIVGGLEVADIQEHSRFAQRAYDRGYIIPTPPPSPRFRTVARDGAIDFYWDDSPEFAEDRTSPVPRDFEGYRLYLGESPLDLKLLAQFDNDLAPGDTTGFNTGFGAVRLDPPAVIDGVTYRYRYTAHALRNGFKYYCAVTAFDLGNVEIESLESGTGQNLSLTIPGPAEGERPKGKVYVFPNPYRVEARWDLGRGVRDHYLWFTNLPKRCTLRIYTLAGDQVFERRFDGDAYRGDNARGVYDPRQPVTPQPPRLSGTTFAWNLITDQGQAVATGLYLFSVEDEDGDTTVGKFLIVKSDREEF
uniref:Uncharacterized protein n=1 Tax=Eiseniibacteriota bacterium TaxID=2212470 RepID=A0A832I2P3_UNCEI